MPVSPTSDDRRRDALLILLLLAREAGLPPEQVDSPEARALVTRGAGFRRAAYRTTPWGRHRPVWACPRRRPTV